MEANTAGLDHLFEEALRIARGTLPEAHPLFASCVGNLALIYHQEGRTAEAEPLYEEAVSGLRRHMVSKGAQLLQADEEAGEALTVLTR